MISDFIQQCIQGYEPTNGNDNGSENGNGHKSNTNRLVVTGVAQSQVELEQRIKQAREEHADAKLRPNCSLGKDMNTWDIEATFRRAGLIAGSLDEKGRIAVRCPYEDEHSQDTGIKQAVIWPLDPDSDRKRPGFNCQHKTCQMAGLRKPETLFALSWTFPTAWIDEHCLDAVVAKTGVDMETKPMIIVHGQEQIHVSLMALDELRKQNKPPRLFAIDGVLARSRYLGGSVNTQFLDVDALEWHLLGLARWRTVRGRPKKSEEEEESEES